MASSKPGGRSKSPRQSAGRTKPPSNRGGRAKPKPVVLLSGGNPQIAMGEGDAPVQAYIAALADWKREKARRLDALITRLVPSVQKAVKWNSPLYGAGQGWFLSMHAFTKFLRVTFFRGTALNPLPPGGSKTPDTRYLDLRETDEPDSAQVASWVTQAARKPGWLSNRA